MPEEPPVVSDPVPEQQPPVLSAKVRATIPISLDEDSLDLIVLEGQDPEEAVVSFCREHLSEDVAACIRQLLPTVLDKLDG